MSIRYASTYETEDGPVRRYIVDGETYDFTRGGFLLDEGGGLITDETIRRHTLRAIAQLEAFK